MKIITLKEAPHLLEETLRLIETAFNYESSNKFQIDFAPLISKRNHHHCYIMVDDNEKVIAHIGVKERNIGNHPIALLGGIAVDKSRRGEGIFQQLMLEVLSETKYDVAMFILWSDQEKLYQKFGFHLCGHQFQTQKSINKRKNFIKTKYVHLSSEEQKRIRDLYENSYCKDYVSINRNEQDWEEIKEIVSADLYILREENLIIEYYFQNKGQDLSGIIYEYGSLRSLPECIMDLSALGNVWGPKLINESDEPHYQFMLAPGRTSLLAEFVNDYSKGQIQIKDLNHVKQEIYYYFQNDLFGMDIKEFFECLLGPRQFEEFKPARPLFISGLDSI